jgi:chromate transporter
MSQKLQTMTLKPRTGLWDLFITWLVIGIQSFGGGSSTLLLIHQACIKHGWTDEDEFVRTWALVQVSPGINLVKLTALIGYQLRGWPGLAAATAGLLLPSAVVTVLMTAGFTVIRSQPVVQAVMRGIIPATIGLSLAMGVNMAQPLLTNAYQEGPSRLGGHLVILVSAALLMAANSVSPVVVLLLGGAAGLLLLAVIPVKEKPPVKEGSA